MMSSSAEILKVSPKHEEIMNYLLMYPLASRTEVAEYFQVTRAWLATIVNSDIFQARLAEKQKEIFGEVVVDSVKERLSAVAQLSAERLLEKVEVSEDERFLLDAAMASAKALGYGVKASGPAVQVTNNFTASAELLAAARGRIIEAQATTLTQPEEGK